MASFAVLLAPRTEIVAERDFEWWEVYDQWVAKVIDTTDDVSFAAFAEATGTPSRIALADLTAYRGEGAPIKKLRRGGRLGIHSDSAEAKHYWFNDGQDVDRVLDEIVRAYGGEAILLWTFGHVLTVRAVRMVDGPRPVVRERSVRLVRPHDGARRPGLLDELQRHLAGGAFAPDFAALAGLLEQPSISVKAWFSAFGVDVGQEVVREDAAEVWAAFSDVATALLRGEAPDAAKLKLVNGAIKALGERLPAKPKPKGMARVVAETHATLVTVLGAPTAEVWRVRQLAANRYQSICDGAADERLLVGTDKKGIGTSGAIGRLLECYPREVRRDSVALALAALDAEACNGHAFVGALEALAASAHLAGFTLVVFPTAHEAALRAAMGLEAASGGVSTGRDGWSAEAFIDLAGVTKGSPLELVDKWIDKQRCDALLIRAEASGAVDVREYTQGKRSTASRHATGPERDAALGRAARALLPRDALAALGLPDLLEPGALAESGSGQASDANGTRGEVPALFETMPPAVDVTLDGLQKAARLMPGVCAIRLTPATTDMGWIDHLLGDLKASEGITEATDVSQEMGNVYMKDGRPRPSLPALGRATRLFGELPVGTMVAILRLTDAQLTAEREHATAEARARSEARRAGKPLPEPLPPLVRTTASYERQCYRIV